MKILLLGKNGQLGWELQRSLSVLGQLVALDRHGQGSLCGDLTNLDGLRATVRELRPDVIVNAAAWTNVDLAEQHPEQAHLINALAPQVLAEEQAKVGGWLVHYSTDYVFDGTGTTPWRETDTPNPINEYGRSKLAGEQAIQASGCKHLIFRTSWVYGVHGDNFIKTMLKLGREREEISVVDDQVGAPTGADLLADVTARALRVVRTAPEKAGLYHVAAAGETSWYAYAEFIFETVGWGKTTVHDGVRGAPNALARRAEAAKRQIDPWIVDTIRPVRSAEWPTPSTRPLNSRLDTGKGMHAFALQLPPWQEGVERVLAQLLCG